MKRVVITGMGIYSVLGKNLEEVKKSLYKGSIFTIAGNNKIC